MAGPLIPGVGAGTLLESVLLANERSIRVGAVHRLDFGEAVVLTHDRWKFDAGGIPQYGFLLATARDLAAASQDDDEVLLLRVEGTAPLNMEADLHAVREEALRTALSQQTDPSPSAVLDVELDPFTKNRVSFTGLRCRVLGTFYEDDVDGDKRLEFGADVDNFYATSTYRVLKPLGEGLAAIASYLRPPSSGDPVDLVRIGTVRYSSTRRRAKAAKQDDAAVNINVHDLIGHKTGMFGMTRMGKSNTMKIAVARTFIISERARAAGKAPIGQLIFDPQGEYANPNTQDGTEIAAIGERHVVIYAFGGGRDGRPNVRPLGINFYDPAQIDAVKSFIAAQLAGGTSDYIKSFVQADLQGEPIEGESVSEAFQRRSRAERGRLLLYGALAKADFPQPQHSPKGAQYPWRAWVTMGAELADAVLADLPDSLIKARGGKSVGISRDRLVAICDWIIAKEDDGSGAAIKGFDSLVSGDPYKSVRPIFTQTHNNKPVSGYSKLKPLRPFHAPNAQSDYRDDVYAELTEGRIVIIDLHLGPDSITRQLSEELAGHILERQTETFTSGRDAPRLQVVLEEAHNLFGAQQYKDEYDVWVRLAKEASKLNVGMVYATQEVSGVAHQVLANTKNWVVAHLNNTKEVRHLSQFYDFQAFSDAIIAQEDKGYVRLKTMSSPYIIPVQIDRYGAELVNEARSAVGDRPLPPTTGK